MVVFIPVFIQFTAGLGHLVNNGNETIGLYLFEKLLCRLTSFWKLIDRKFIFGSSFQSL